MKVYLLTHTRELEKSTNTGQVVLQVLGKQYAERITWQRTEPDHQLVELIEQQQIALLYPNKQQATNLVDFNQFERFIVLDATWQEARKMFNRSAYLQTAQSIQLSTENRSQYTLRRNQREGGLCTAECVEQLLKLKGYDSLASQLSSAFLEFNR